MNIVNFIFESFTFWSGFATFLFKLLFIPALCVLVWSGFRYLQRKNQSKTLSNLPEAKQVIVIRKDLRNKEGQKVRSGKIIAQACHASIAFLTDKLRKNEPLNDFEKVWIDGSFTKVCLGVNSEKELLDLHQKCLEMGVTSKLILDAGRTEFSEPTHTCLGIGPDDSEKIGKITGHLSLY